MKKNIKKLKHKNIMKKIIMEKIEKMFSKLKTKIIWKKLKKCFQN